MNAERLVVFFLKFSLRAFTVILRYKNDNRIMLDNGSYFTCLILFDNEWGE